MCFAIVLAALVAWPSIGYSGGAPECPWAPAPHQNIKTVIDIDNVWTGTRVDFAAAKNNDRFVIGYYNQDRWLTVVTAAESGVIKRHLLDTRFAGWDSHNSVALAIDRNGLLHVAANMHATKLNYFRAAAPDQAPAKVEMMQDDNDLVTYPQFLKTSDGDLLFIFRSGRSGDGRWKVRRWDGRSWSNVGNGPILSDRGFGGRVSGYPSRFFIGSDQNIHLAIVWRLSADAATNVRLSYAKTRDFVTWFDSRGRRLADPLSPESAETVLHTGPNAGLLNNAKVSINPQGRPVIVFTRQNEQGHNTVELAVSDQGRWQIVPVAVSDRGIPVRGLGSLPETVALSEVDFRAPDRPRLTFRFPGLATTQQILDPKTLAPACVEKPSPDPAATFIKPSIPTMKPQLLRVGQQATFVWSAQPANNDTRRACTADAPRACDPPASPLRLLINAPGAN